MDRQQRLVVRTGCLSCRARGVPCKPEDPLCQRNVSTSWDTNRSVSERKPKRTRGVRWWQEQHPSILTLDYSWKGTLRERKSLYFFCTNTAPELAGYFDAAFWRFFLLQATQSDTATCTPSPP